MPKEDPFVNRAQLLKAIKKYPEIWDSNNKLHMCRSVTAPMWNEIAEQFGGHVPTVKLQSIWSQMKYHYHNLVHRQILHKERFTTKWEHFESMSFMHNITVAKIVGSGANVPAETSELAGSANSVELNLSQSQPPLLPQSQGRGRPSGNFTWLPPLTIQSELNNTGVTVFPAFTGLVPPAAVTIETTATPLRKPGRSGSLNNSMRGRIIEVIKARPLLWSGRQKSDQKGHNRTSAIWKEVAAELNLTPSLVQTRWSIIKQRYVDELQKERHARYVQESFHSNWEHFERMSFMRDMLLKKVDEREQTREQIQEIVNEKQQMLNMHHQHQHQQQQHHHHHQQQQHQQQQQQLDTHHEQLHNYDAQHLRYIRNSVSNVITESHNLLLPPLPAHHLVNADAHNRALHSRHLHHLHTLSMCDENPTTDSDTDNSKSRNDRSHSRINTTVGGTNISRNNSNSNNNNNNNNTNINNEHNHLSDHNQSLSLSGNNGIVGATSIMNLMPHQTVVAYTGGTRFINPKRVKHVNDLEWDSFEMMLHVQNATDAAAAVNAASAAAATAAAAVNN